MWIFTFTNFYTDNHIQACYTHTQTLHLHTDIYSIYHKHTQRVILKLTADLAERPSSESEASADDGSEEKDVSCLYKHIFSVLPSLCRFHTFPQCFSGEGTETQEKDFRLELQLVFPTSLGVAEALQCWHLEGIFFLKCRNAK